MTEKLDNEKIAYTVHPVSPELKKELTRKGYKIIDAKFAGDKDKIFNAAVQDKEQAPESRANEK